MNSSDYIEVTVILNPFSEEAAEILMAELGELPFDSFSVEEPSLKCYIQREEYRPSDVKVVLSGYDFVEGFSANLVTGRNWNQAWEDSFEPIVVEPSLVTVKASFNENPPHSRFNIWMNPSMAFGTGYHDTTYMMMEEMLRLESSIRNHNVLDMGCGTGVLAILAAKMGAKRVWAIDIDAVAAKSAWGNVRWNRVSPRVQVLCGDASLMQMGLYDVILANIHRNILIQDMSTYVRSLRRGGKLLVSGFFPSDEEAVSSAALSEGLTALSRSERGGWVSLGFTK